MSRFWQGAAFLQKGQVERRLAYFTYSFMLFLRFSLPKTFTYLQHTHTTQQQKIKIQPTSSHKSVLKHAKKCPNANFIQLLRFLCANKSSEPTGIKIDCKFDIWKGVNRVGNYLKAIFYGPAESRAEKKWTCRHWKGFFGYEGVSQKNLLFVPFMILFFLLCGLMPTNPIWFIYKFDWGWI